MSAELLAAFRRGDTPALAEVWRRCAFPLDRYVRRGFTVKSTGLRVPPIRNRARRADVTQETFRRAYEEAARLAYDGVRDFFLYLLGIACNVIVSGHRHDDRERPAGGRDSWADGQIADIELDDEPDNRGCKPEALAILREYVASLPEIERAFVTARLLEGEAQESVAERLGMTRWTVRSLEVRLRKELRARLTKAGIGDPFDG